MAIFRFRDPVRGEVFHLALPIVASNLLSRGVGIVDTAIVGRLGAEEVSAVGLGQVVIFLLLTLIFGIQTGTGVRVAHATGAKDSERRREAASRGVVLAIVVGGLSACIGWWGSASLLALLGASQETASLAVSYLKIVSLGLVLKALVVVGVAIFHGQGESRFPLRVMVWANLLHITLSFLLVYGYDGVIQVPSLGVEGAGIAFIAGDAFALTFLFFRLFRGGFFLYAPRRRRVGEEKKILLLAAPVMAERLMVAVMQMVFAGTIVRSSVAAYAAHQIGFSIEAFAFLPGMAFATATTALVGQALGAGDRDLAHRRAREAHRLSFCFMSLMGFSFFLFPEWWFGFFTTDTEVLGYGILYCGVTAFAQPLIATGQVMAGALRGASMTRQVLYAHFVGAWCVRVPLSILFGVVLEWHPVWVWATQIADWMVRDVLLLWWATRAGVGFKRRSGSQPTAPCTIATGEF